MKITFIAFLLLFWLVSCNSKDQTKSNYKDSANIDTYLINKQKTDSLDYRDSTLNENILGVWGIIGEHKASFVIDKKKIFYPEKDTYYSYKIINDSLNITDEDFDITFKIKLNITNDTLVLTGEEIHKFRRLEN